jgi:hypothetical protein
MTGNFPLGNGNLLIAFDHTYQINDEAADQCVPNPFGSDDCVVSV